MSIQVARFFLYTNVTLFFSSISDTTISILHMFLKSFFSHQTTILFSLLHTYCFHHNLYHCTHIYMFHFCSHTLAVFITIALYHSSHILLHFTLLVTFFSFTNCSIGTFLQNSFQFLFILPCFSLFCFSVFLSHIC